VLYLLRCSASGWTTRCCPPARVLDDVRTDRRRAGRLRRTRW
jgi:hypothetical protein